MVEEEEGEDLWTAPDKFHHVIFCFSLTLVFSLLAARTPHRFLRRRPILVGSFLSLSAGAAKEFADHLGFFHSSGASIKDAAADAVGVLLACFLVFLFKLLFARSRPLPDDHVRGIGLV